MSPESTPPTHNPSASRLRGSLVRRAAASEPVASRLKYRGSRSEAETRHESPSVRLIPEDYDMPEECVERVVRRRNNPDLTPIDDPDGLIAPGMLLKSSGDPTRRRLVTQMYNNSVGNAMAVVHIEGDRSTWNVSLELLHTKLAEGTLLLPEPPKPE